MRVIVYRVPPLTFKDAAIGHEFTVRKVRVAQENAGNVEESKKVDIVDRVQGAMDEAYQQ